MFRTADFLADNWSDAHGLRKFLAAYGHDLKAPTIYQWFRRSQVPSEWAFVLIGLLEIERGAPPSLAKYFQ